MPFTPGDPWPSSTPGGVAAPDWGGYTRLWLLAEIAPGIPWTLDDPVAGRLDAGNVLGFIDSHGSDKYSTGTLPTAGTLWVDLTCDCVQIDTHGGANTTKGVLTKVEAGTLVAKLWDPDGRYDPLNPDSPFAVGPRSKLRAGVRIVLYTETIIDPTVASPIVLGWRLFTGTVDKWSEEWTKEPGERFATVTATDLVKDLVKMNRAEQPPVGAGDSVFARLGRICTYFGVNPPTGIGPLSTRTLQATTLAQSAWEMLNRSADDDLGFLYVSGLGTLIYLSDQAWTYLGTGTPVDLEIGCDDPGMLDIVVDATPSDVDKDQINTVTAAVTGGVEQTVSISSSTDLYGELSYKRTDLGLASDAQAAGWAERLVSLSAYPRSTVDNIVMVPAVDAEPWTAFRSVFLFSPVISIVRLAFRTPRFDYQIDELARMVGWQHTITLTRWSVTWLTVAANMASGANVWTLNEPNLGRLDAGNVLA